jgi:purine-binding chemotaxis protein CheW
MQTDVETKNAFLTFKLDSEIFAIKVEKILEVLELTKITRIPKTPGYIRGVINLRGEIIPVIDLRSLFNVDTIRDTIDTVIIILDMEHHNKKMMLGAVVDSVHEVIDVIKTKIREVPELGSRYNTQFLLGMIKKDNNFVMLLDIDNIFIHSSIGMNEKN